MLLCKQWDCECGAHNLMIYGNCKKCGASITTSKIGRTSPLKAIDTPVNKPPKKSAS